ncbi:MAG: hypothetical protein FWG45_06885, partial [Oscillospiraceae bacterium]|nr:hypothetical protein [Oscillospiraceae bacterium]
SRAFVTVTATPSAADFIKIGFPNNNVNTRISATATERQDHRESAVNYNQKNRYPYEITLKGATRTLQRNMSNSGLVRHVNGGGWIASASRVDASVYVGPNARVLGSATVRGNAVIDGYAVVEGSAAISENARIDGFAYVAGNARVSGRAHVTDRAFLMGNVAVSGDAKIMGSAWMHERAGATDNTIIQGMSEAHGNTQGTPNPNAYVTGQGIADGDYFVFNRTHNRGVVAGYIPADGYFTNRPFTDGLHHGYDFAESKITSPIIDRRHGTYASPYGEPLLEATRTSASGVLTLNGHDQYVNVSRNVSMFRDFEIQTAVLWRGGAANQKVFHFGDKDEHMYFTPSNENGVAEFVIKTEDAEQRLTANAPLPLGRWTVVTIRKVGNTGTLTFNVGGKIGDDTPTSIPAVTNGTMFLNPVQVSGKHDDEAVYSLGRGVDGEYFNGSYDYFDVYFKAAPAPTYGYTEMEEISLTCDHLFPDEWELVTPADCYQDGEESRVCMREGCDVTEERAVKANKVISLILDEYVAVGNHADTALSLKGLYLFDADAVDDTKIEEWWRMPALIMQGDSFLFFGDGLKYTRIGFKTIHTERLRLVTADGTSVACWNAAGVCIC